MTKIKVTKTFEDGYLSEATINGHTTISYMSGEANIEDDTIIITTSLPLNVEEVRELVRILNKMLEGL